MSVCLAYNRDDPVSVTDATERSRSGRIEHYIHNDAITPNKGGALVKVVCDTDFAARTPEFVQFARKVAKFAYAASAASWNDIVVVYPEMADELRELQQVLKERISVSGVACMKI
jgi:translation elongation factor EF-Ts